MHFRTSRLPTAAALALGVLLAAAPQADDPKPDVRAEAGPIEAAATEDGALPFQIDRGEDRLPLFVPRGEKLTYRVDVAWGFVGAALGTVTMTTGVEPYRKSLLVPNAPAEAGAGDEEAEPPMTAWIKAHAYGKHLLYTMDATLETRHQPQEWPRIVYRSTQKGSETRRRELLVGTKGETPTCSYRRDTDKGAPSGTRIWKDPELREIPEQTLDMTSAVYLVRTFVMRGLDEITIPVVQKDELWQIRLALGEELVKETPAGTFDAVEVLIETRRHPDDHDDLDEDDPTEFEGLFGLRGGIHLWVHRRTGVPIRIQGEVPAGPITLDVDIKLTGFSGTPRSFQPLP